MIDLQKNNLPLDLSYLRDMSGDSIEFMIEMLDAFAEQTPIMMTDLEQAINAQDWKTASERAHKIKPTFAYLGRDDAKDCMQIIENNTRDLINLQNIPANFSEIKTFVVVLYAQLNKARAELQTQL